MKEILACLDGSQRAPEVLAVAVDLAKHYGGKVIPFRVVTLPTEIPSDLYASTPADVPKRLLERAAIELAEVSRGIPAELLREAHAEIGSPWDAICRAARTYDVDLIVIGSHGYGPLDHLIGTTAAKVVNHADRPVLVTRPKGPPK